MNDANNSIATLEAHNVGTDSNDFAGRFPTKLLWQRKQLAAGQ
jgi:hypothetical protein